MKKVSLFLLAGGLLTFAACKEEGTTTGGMTQEQVDSAVNAKVNLALDSMSLAMDAEINARAQYLADSMMAVRTGAPAPAPRPTTGTRNPRPSAPSTPSTPAPTKQDQKFEQRENGGRTISNEKKQEQDEKFNRRGG